MYTFLKKKRKKLEKTRQNKPKIKKVNCAKKIGLRCFAFFAFAS